MIIGSPWRRISLLFYFVAFVVLVLLHRSRYLIGLLFEDGGRDSISPSDVPSENTTLPLLIPKIIHQTYKNEDLPEHWKNAQNAVKYYHPDYEYMFWTDETGLEFIKTHYPSFIPTYVGYPYTIQRVDALRYFLLYHYGGVYIDLDLFTYKPLTPLLTLPAVACRTTPTGISNDILFSTPQHPFFTLVIERLEDYSRNLLVPYLTVMYTTGPLFLSAIWIEYLRGKDKGGRTLDRLHVLIQGPVKGDNYGFWKNIRGGSWHKQDMYVMLWMGDHLIISTLLGFAIGICVVILLWKAFKMCTAMFRGGRWLELQREKDRRQDAERQRAMWKLHQLA